MTFAAIYVPEFPAEAVMRATPDLREQAVAVVEGVPPLLHVISVNERARGKGVEIGMTELQARGRVRELEVRHRSPSLEAGAHAALLDCACAFSPRVEDTAADTMLLDLQGLERLFGPPATIARSLAQRASELGLEARVAVAAKVETALLAARGFPGVTVIPEGQEAERLAPLPIEVLQTQTTHSADQTGMLETLDRWGVRTLRALAALPEVALSERLGEAGLRWQKLARGEGLRPLVAAEPPLVFEEAMELEYPVELLEPLAFILNGMLERLCARLAARALSTGELRLRLQYEGSAELNRGSIGMKADPRAENSRQVRGPQSKIATRRTNQNTQIELPSADQDYWLLLRLPVPMLDPKVFLKLLQLELKAKPPMAAIVRAWLSAEPARPRVTQGELFLPGAPEPQRLELTLARIKAVIGNQESKSPGQQDAKQVPGASDVELRAGSPELCDSHFPDAFRMCPFRVPAADADRMMPATVTPARKKPAMAALRRFRPPIRVSVELWGGRPVRLHGNGVITGEQSNGLGADGRWQAEVLWAAGPWRASGDWWSAAAWSREEWDLAVAASGRTVVYRLYRDPLKDEWWIEASYD